MCNVKPHGYQDLNLLIARDFHVQIYLIFLPIHVKNLDNITYRHYTVFIRVAIWQQYCIHCFQHGKYYSIVWSKCIIYVLVHCTIQDMQLLTAMNIANKCFWKVFIIIFICARLSYPGTWTSAKKYNFSRIFFGDLKSW